MHFVAGGHLFQPDLTETNNVWKVACKWVKKKRPAFSFLLVFEHFRNMASPYPLPGIPILVPFQGAIFAGCLMQNLDF